MYKKTKRFFNTSGPCFPHQNYTLMRNSLLAKGIDLVEIERKKQVAYYAKTRSLLEAYYVVFVAKTHEQKKSLIQEKEERLKGINVKTFIIWYDENKDF